MTILSNHADYGYVILSAIAVSTQYLSHGFSAGGERGRLKVDYPDMGEGRHAAKLSDKQWAEFGILQRVHYNYLENIGPVLSQILLSGLFYPRFTAGLSVVYLAGRSLFARGYVKNGPKGRVLGARLSGLTMLTMMGTTAYGAVQLLQWI
ncbi:hypothetical protein RI367_004044 [Sorochytrium milnesiophthora]